MDYATRATNRGDCYFVRQNIKETRKSFEEPTRCNLFGLLAKKKRGAKKREEGYWRERYTCDEAAQERKGREREKERGKAREKGRRELTRRCMEKRRREGKLMKKVELLVRERARDRETER